MSTPAIRLRIQGNVVGPFTPEQVTDLAKQGRLFAQDEISIDGGATWALIQRTSLGPLLPGAEPVEPTPGSMSSPPATPVARPSTATMPTPPAPVPTIRFSIRCRNPAGQQVKGVVLADSRAQLLDRLSADQFTEVEVLDAQVADPAQSPPAALAQVNAPAPATPQPPPLVDREANTGWGEFDFEAKGTPPARRANAARPMGEKPVAFASRQVGLALSIAGTVLIIVGKIAAESPSEAANIAAGFCFLIGLGSSFIGMVMLARSRGRHWAHGFFCLLSILGLLYVCNLKEKEEASAVSEGESPLPAGTERRDGAAKAGMILGVASIPLLVACGTGLLTAIVGLILSIRARGHTKRKGQVTAGLWLNGAAIVLGIFIVPGIVIPMIGAANHAADRMKGEQVSASSNAPPEELEAAANAGDVDAMYSRGVMLALGEDESEQTQVQAKMWIEKAAKGGNVNAMCLLGCMLGVKSTEATEWLTRSAQAGNIDAKNILDLMSESDYVKKQSQWYIQMHSVLGGIKGTPQYKSMQRLRDEAKQLDDKYNGANR